MWTYVMWLVALAALAGAGYYVYIMYFADKGSSASAARGTTAPRPPPPPRDSMPVDTDPPPAETTEGKAKAKKIIDSLEKAVGSVAKPGAPSPEDTAVTKCFLGKNRGGVGLCARVPAGVRCQQDVTDDNVCGMTFDMEADPTKKGV